MRVAFIGLGVMGYPMAGHLANAGNAVTVFNRTTAKAEQWVSQYAGTLALTAAAAAEGAEVVFVCVGNDDDVLAVIDGADGVFKGIAPGSLLVDHTTASAVLARKLHAKAGDQSVGFIDAPVSGGQAGAESGQLTIMAGGDLADFERAERVMKCYAKACKYIGPTGSGQLTKMVNQICIAGIVQGLSEALHFAERSGLDSAAVIDAISKGAAQSWQMENRWKNMIAGEFEFGFAVEWMRKDLKIALDEASRNGAQLEMTRLVDSYYAEVQALGGNRWDTSSLIARLEKP